ncbi:LLM class flavin-dependent oxidoreductase [Candidatus Bathyarchaeota archaeon]|nr:LLM class flavin-dependent oxidoreductase [Candidatus Bathyarchaeota archaeon]
MFGVHFPIHGPYGYEAFLETTVLADKLGFDCLTVGDHFFLPSETYSNLGWDPDRPNKLDAWIVLTAAAVKTERIRLGTRVSPVPFYVPPRLAKMVATADIISHGRTLLGVGAGWYKWEAISYGVGWGSHRERIEKMLEGLEIILRLWTQNRTTFKGKYYQVSDAPFWPKPVQKPHPPIWFGGYSDAIVEATVKYGEGLFPPVNMEMEKLEDIQRRLRKAAERLGRADLPIIAPSISYPKGTGTESAEWLRSVEALSERGFGLILLDFTVDYVPLKKIHVFLKRFTEEVMPSFC